MTSDYPRAAATSDKWRDRRGAILVAAIVCLVVVLLLGAAILRSLAIQHRLGRDDLYRMQSFWLAESAAGRAAARLRSDPAYGGELWCVGLEGGDGNEMGRATIVVEQPSGQSNVRRVRIEAQWPEESLRRGVYRRELLIQLAAAGDVP